MTAKKLKESNRKFSLQRNQGFMMPEKVHTTNTEWKISAEKVQRLFSSVHSGAAENMQNHK